VTASLARKTLSVLKNVALMPVAVNILAVGSAFAIRDFKAMAFPVNRMEHVLGYNAVSMPSAYMPRKTQENVCVTRDIKEMDRIVLHVTNVKGLHVDLMQPVMTRENAPAIKVSKEMDSGVMMSMNVKKVCTSVTQTLTALTL